MSRVPALLLCAALVHATALAQSPPAKSATSGEKLRDQDRTINDTLGRLDMEKPADREQAVKIIRGLIRRETDPDLMRTAGEKLGQAGLLLKEEEALQGELKQNPLGTVIHRNLYRLHIGAAEVRNLPDPRRDVRWVPYAEHLVKHRAADADMAIRLANYYRQENRPADAGAAWMQAVRADPSLDPAAACRGPLADELHNAGLVSQFVAAKVAWMKKMNDGHLEQRLSLQALTPFVEQLLNLPDGKAAAKDLLAGFAAVKRDYTTIYLNGWCHGTLELIPLYAKAGAEKELAAAVLRAFSPPPAEPPAGRNPLQLFEFWVGTGRSARRGDLQPPLAGVELLEFLKRQDMLPTLVTALEKDAARPGLGSEFRQRPWQLLLAAQCVLAPERAKDYFRQYLDAGGKLTTDLMLLPGFTATLYFHVSIDWLDAPRDGAVARQVSKSKIGMDLLASCLQKKETADDAALVRDLLLLNARLLHESKPSSPEKRNAWDRRLAAQGILTMLMARGMGAEAAQVFDDTAEDFRLTNGSPAHSALPALMDIQKAAAASGGTELNEKVTLAIGRMLTDLPQPAYWNEPVTGHVLTWALTTAAAGNREEASRVLRLLRQSGLRDTEPYRGGIEKLAGLPGISGGTEFLTWQALSPGGERLLCWHAGSVQSADLVPPGTVPLTFTWPMDQAKPVPNQTLTVLAGPDGERWTETGPPVSLTIAGHTPLPDGPWIRAERRVNGEARFGEPVRREEVLYSSAGTPPSLMVKEPRWPDGGTPEPAPEWKPLPASAHPGAVGWEVEVPLTSSQGFALMTPRLPMDPLKPVQLTGWIRVEGPPKVTAEIWLDGANARTMPVGDAAWHFIPPNEPLAEPDESGSRRHARRLWLVVKGPPQMTAPATVRIACSDLLVQSLPIPGAPPWPQRIIGDPWSNAVVRDTGADCYTLALSPDGRWLAAGTRDGRVLRIAADGGGKPPVTLTKLRTIAGQIVISADGQLIYVQTHGGGLYRLNASAPGEAEPLVPEPVRRGGRAAVHLVPKPAGSTLTAFAISPSGDTAARVNEAGLIIIFPLKAGGGVWGGEAKSNAWSLPADTSVRLDFSTDGKRLLAEAVPSKQPPWDTAAPRPKVTVLNVEDGMPVTPATDGNSRPPVELPPQRSFGDRWPLVYSAAGWTGMVTCEKSALRLYRSDNSSTEPASSWTMQGFNPRLSVLDRISGILFTVEHNGVVRRWELPQK